MAETPSVRAGEFALIDRYFAPLAAQFPGAFGLGDDTARFALPPGCELVVTTDTLVAGIHFFADDPAPEIARKSLRVSLSDLAAAGAQPLAYQLSTAWPADIEEAWIAAFADGLAADQAMFGIHLCGGDTVATSGPLTVTVTAFGTVPQRQGLGRAGARPGDALMVSGSIGDGWLGLACLKGAFNAMPAALRAIAIDRYRLPRPRSQLGPALVGRAGACIDVSDGLVADLTHLCERSKCGAILELDRVPLSPAASAAISQQPDSLLQMIAGGDDYELLFSVDAGRADATIRELSSPAVPVTQIGRFVSGSQVQIVRADGTSQSIAATGWKHF